MMRNQNVQFDALLEARAASDRGIDKHMQETCRPWLLSSGFHRNETSGNSHPASTDRPCAGPNLRHVDVFGKVEARRVHYGRLAIVRRDSFSVTRERAYTSTRCWGTW
jgi:hypothetical protein